MSSENLKLRKVNMPTVKFSLKCPNALKADGIVIHNTANDASAAAEISYMQSNNAYTSFHFAVDDVEAVQGVELDRNTWHAGDGTGSGSANRSKISIEICYSKFGGEKFIKAEKNAAKLAAMLCKEYGWSVSRISKHQDYKATECPHRTVQLGWKRFIDMVRKELDGLSDACEETPENTDELQEIIRLQNTQIKDLSDKLDRIKKIVV